MDRISRRRGGRTGLVGLLALVLAGCALSAPGDFDEVQRELNRSRRQWEAEAIRDYRFVARRLCFCGNEVTAPVVVEVRAGQPVSRTYEGSGDPVSETYRELWPAIDGVFGIVQDAIDREAYRIEVEYDAELRFPRSVVIDYLEHAVDEELRFEVSDLAPLP